MRALLLAWLVCAAACDAARRHSGLGDGGADLGAGAGDMATAAPPDLAGDLASASGDMTMTTVTVDFATGAGSDLATATPDLKPPADMKPPSDMTTSSGGVISGGPCLSGAAGATAFRMRWSGSGGSATPVYEAFGLPDSSREHVAAYGYNIGFTPSYVDTALAQGGLLLDSSDFVDIELSTVGLSTIRSATLSIYGRSYNTTTSGSFNWQTFAGTGAAPNNLVWNSAPYQWYSASMLTEIDPGDDTVLIRIKAGPSSGTLAVNRIEICMDAS